MALIKAIFFDNAHPASAARFWAQALDNYELAPYDDEELARLRDLGLAPGLLPRRRDVDTWDDARVVADQCPEGRFGRALHRLAREAA